MKIIPYSFHVLHPFAVTIIGTNCHGINNCNLVLNTPASQSADPCYSGRNSENAAAAGGFHSAS